MIRLTMVDYNIRSVTEIPRSGAKLVWFLVIMIGTFGLGVVNWLSPFGIEIFKNTIVYLKLLEISTNILNKFDKKTILNNISPNFRAEDLPGVTVPDIFKLFSNLKDL